MKLNRFMKTRTGYVVVGALSILAFFLLFGVVTVLIPNPWFTRMTSITFLDYFFLITSSALLGIYVAVHLYKKNSSNRCTVATYSGGVGSFLAFSCPICNQLLVVLFGTTALLTYFEPYRPILGFLSIGVLVGALYLRLKKRCSRIPLSTSL